MRPSSANLLSVRFILYYMYSVCSYACVHLFVVHHRRLVICMCTFVSKGLFLLNKLSVYAYLFNKFPANWSTLCAHFV